MSGESSALKRTIGMLAHTEFASNDPKITKEFLQRVFNWQFSTVESPQGELISYRTPGGAEGSIRKTHPQEIPASMNYVLVEDLASTEGKIKAFGGTIVLPRVDVPGMGSFFWFKVPEGPLLACWQDAPKQQK